MLKNILVLCLLLAGRDWLGPEFARQLAGEAKAACGREFRIPLGKTGPVAAIRALVGGEEGKEIYVQFLKDRYGYAIERVNEIYGQQATSFTELLTRDFRGVDETRGDVGADDVAFVEILLAHWERAVSRGRGECGLTGTNELKIEKNALWVGARPGPARD